MKLFGGAFLRAGPFERLLLGRPVGKASLSERQPDEIIWWGAPAGGPVRKASFGQARRKGFIVRMPARQNYLVGRSNVSPTKLLWPDRPNASPTKLFGGTVRMPAQRNYSGGTVRTPAQRNYSGGTVRMPAQRNYSGGTVLMPARQNYLVGRSCGRARSKGFLWAGSSERLHRPNASPTKLFWRGVPSGSTFLQAGPSERLSRPKGFLWASLHVIFII